MNLDEFDTCSLSFLNKLCPEFLSELYFGTIMHFVNFLLFPLNLINQLVKDRNCLLAQRFIITLESDSIFINLNLEEGLIAFNFF